MSFIRPYNNKAWLGVLPVLLVVGFSGVIPLMAVVNYSVQDILDMNTRFFVGFEWYEQTLSDPKLVAAFLRQITFSLTVLAIEIPLGILVAKGLPTNSRLTPFLLVFLAIPLLIPWNVVGTIWQIFARADIGLLGVAVNELGFDYNYSAQPLHAWLTLIAMDVWHWTSLVALLAFAGLTSIPQPYYQAAQLDGANAWQVFPFCRVPTFAQCIDDCRIAAPYGQFYDLYRTFCTYRWWAWQYHNLFKPIPSNHGGGPI